MRVRGIRGATQIDTDNPEQIVDSVSELLTQMLAVNHIEVEDLISIIFTSTPDLTSEFPAVAARKIGLGNVPLLCSLPRVVRVLIHAHLDRQLTEVKHVYLKGASVLRKDLAQ